MPTVAFLTFGCKANQYDTQAMREELTAVGYRTVTPPTRADLYVVNTCTVTGMADAKARQAIRKLHRLTPSSRIFVTGCYAQNAGEDLLAIKGVTKVFGNREKAACAELVRESERTQAIAQEFVGDPDAPVDLGEFGLSVASFDERTRSLVKVQDGCSAFCTYCIIPYVRGRMRSRPLPDIVAEVRRLTARGHGEVVITGVHLGAYGQDLRRKWSLVDVLEALHDTPGLSRIRVSSIEPMDVPLSLVRAMGALPKCAHHAHLPLQSGSNTVLQRMHRRYTTEQFGALVDAFRGAMPDVGLTTDVMVAFPGETDADFDATCEVVERSGFHRLHVFRYSPRDGTPAARLPHRLPADVATDRSHRLRQLGGRLAREFQEGLVDTAADVLVEERREGPRRQLAGYTGNYLRVLTDADESDVGRLLRVRLTGIDGQHMLGIVETEAQQLSAAT